MLCENCKNLKKSNCADEFERFQSQDGLMDHCHDGNPECMSFGLSECHFGLKDDSLKAVDFENPIKIREIHEECTGQRALKGSEGVLKYIKRNFSSLRNENSGQGAAEYILLFGGVIVIALAGLLIYRSYFSNNASGLNATQDISSIRNNMTGLN